MLWEICLTALIHADRLRLRLSSSIVHCCHCTSGYKRVEQSALRYRPGFGNAVYQDVGSYLIYNLFSKQFTVGVRFYSPSSLLYRGSRFAPENRFKRGPTT